MLGRYLPAIMNTINRDVHDYVLEAEDCAGHCPQWLFFLIPIAAVVCMSAALLVG
jgi:hypothetical protein